MFPSDRSTQASRLRKVQALALLPSPARRQEHMSIKVLLQRVALPRQLSTPVIPNLTHFSHSLHRERRCIQQRHTTRGPMWDHAYMK